MSKVVGNLNVIGDLTVIGTSPNSPEFTATDKTASYTAVSGDWVIYDLSAAGAAVTLTLPTTPSQGDAVKVTLKSENTSSAIYVGIGRNGSTIDGGTAAEFENYNILWKNGDSVTFRCVASGAWVTAERQIANRFAAAMTKASSQSINNISLTKINLDTATFDYNGDVDTTTDYDYTVPITGIYQVNAGIRFDPAADSSYTCLVNKNNSTSTELEAVGYTSSTIIDDININTAGLIQFNVGDTIELFAFHRSGGAQNVLGGENKTFIKINLVSRSS